MFNTCTCVYVYVGYIVTYNLHDIRVVLNGYNMFYFTFFSFKNKKEKTPSTHRFNMNRKRPGRKKKHKKQKRLTEIDFYRRIISCRARELISPAADRRYPTTTTTTDNLGPAPPAARCFLLDVGGARCPGKIR